mmetsp:Transcript_17119/g.19150  ORF Transcript_17119/g.19150 Transcript_17119/m.19150 type:complete len:147 (-) Transcript_17119:7-447(-)
MKNLTSGDSLGFALFLGGVSAFYKLTLCLLRRFNPSNEKYNAALAGFIASFACLFDKNISRRQGIVFYLSARVFETSLKLMDSHKIMDEPKDWGLYFSLFCSALFIYQLWCEQDTALDSVIKIMDKFGNISNNDRGIMLILHKAPW